MATVRNKVNPQLLDQMLRLEKLVCSAQLTPVAGAPVLSTDVPSVLFLRSAGNTATVDAIETLTWTTPVNASTSIFGLYLKIGTTVTPSLGPVPTAENYADAVYSAAVLDDTSTSAAATALTASGPNAVYGMNCWLTPLGNIAIEVTVTKNISTTAMNMVINTDYREQVK